MSMADRDGVIWFDGELVPWRDATTHVLTHTLHYGMGVFEGVRAYNTLKGTGIFRMKEHTDRLFRSAHIMRMEIPFTKEQISPTRDTRLRWMQSVVRCTHYVAGAGEKAYLRQEDAPEITFVERDTIDRSDEAYAEIPA